MCEPVSAFIAANQLAIAGASAAASTLGAVSQYNEQTDTAEANQQAAKDAYILQSHLTNRKLMEERTSISQKKQDNSIKRMQSSASGVAMAAAGGVQGASVDQMLDDFRRNEGVISDRYDQTMESKELQATYDMRGAKATADSRIQANKGPSLAGVYTTAIRGAGSFASSASDFKDLYDGDYDV
jgi:hypothetical protein